MSNLFADKKTSTPTAPAWAANAAQDATGRITALGNQDPKSFVAPVDPLQTQAGVGAASLTGSPGQFKAAQDETNFIVNRPAVQFSSTQAKDYIPDYLNPFLNSVVNSADADLTHNEGNVRAQQALDLTRSGAFGGSGAALTQSATEGELARARASTLSGLRSQGYSQALGAAQQDADRRQQANFENAQLRDANINRALAGSNQTANLAALFDANNRANIGTQLGVGGTLRDVNQQTVQAPLALAQFQAQNIPGLIHPFFGQQDVNTPSIGSDVGKIAAIASLFA